MGLYLGGVGISADAAGGGTTNTAAATAAGSGGGGGGVSAGGGGGGSGGGRGQPGDTDMLYSLAEKIRSQYFNGILPATEASGDAAGPATLRSEEENARTHEQVCAIAREI
jgi:hypothetical protein